MSAEFALAILWPIRFTNDKVETEITTNNL